MLEKVLPENLRTKTLLTLCRISQEAAAADPAHDFAHCTRVLHNALEIARTEGGPQIARQDVLTAAALLHDIANLPKSHPQSAQSSTLSAEKAAVILRETGFDAEAIPLVQDAILCHSFSRGLTPQTLEGRIFQDADRLDAIGAIGIARTYVVGGAAGRPLYWPEDPFCEHGRKPCDKPPADGPNTANTLDHFPIKLFKLPAMMQTATGKRLAEERVRFMMSFMDQLRREIPDYTTLS